jgi:hypothetical protein
LKTIRSDKELTDDLDSPEGADRLDAVLVVVSTVTSGSDSAASGRKPLVNESYSFGSTMAGNVMETRS